MKQSFRAMTLLSFVCIRAWTGFGIAAEELSIPLMLELEAKYPRSKKELRINSLWPKDYLVQLSIDPAIPKNFVLKEFPEYGSSGYFAWGPQEALDMEGCLHATNLSFGFRCSENTRDRGADFENKDEGNSRSAISETLVSKDAQEISYFHADKPKIQVTEATQSVLCFRYTPNVAQTGPKSFSGMDTFEESMKELGVVESSKKTCFWGEYPVLDVEGTVKDGPKFFMAWIGCNYCSNVIFVRLVYPAKEGRPNKEDRQLWETFISKTKALSPQEAPLAQGWDLQPGYTWVDISRTRLFALAEKRKKDNLVQIVVISPDKETSFTLEEMWCGMAGEPFLGEEVAKIYTSISTKFPEGGSLEQPSAVINVLLKTVDEFSLNKETLPSDPAIFVHQMPFN